MEHVLTIACAPGAGCEPKDEPWRLVARMEIGSFEDDGYPDLAGGTLLQVPEGLLSDVESGAVVRVELGGQTYRFTALERDGRFRVAKDREAVRFPDEA